MVQKKHLLEYLEGATVALVIFMIWFSVPMLILFTIQKIPFLAELLHG